MGARAVERLDRPSDSVRQRVVGRVARRARQLRRRHPHRLLLARPPSKRHRRHLAMPTPCIGTLRRKTVGGAGKAGGSIIFRVDLAYAQRPRHERA